MLNFTWKVFTQTGSIDTYLLFKELEKEMEEAPDNDTIELANVDYPII
ncbi:YqzL family protein [Caldibacillus lycopersici]|uniref:YqzL family protein n=1 Tax=Perspicuibacillus lycopersici TaxID=1325689 RepID=A0AAE3IT46_9BACI|nr:YqzL family protein [Perspicuibacillus lycopersici]MCU9613912.1 YqzL family protein [Perspicuibacillus lycopersici]